MKDIDRVFMLRRNIIDDWRFRKMSWQDITYKYRVSKAWFYRLRKRFIKYGIEGLKENPRKKPFMPHALGRKMFYRGMFYEQ